MDVLPVNYIPGDPVLIDNIVWELKSQGIFDDFRKECIADVDTKPAYQNLRQRVEGSVSSFLKKQTWSADLNKNQLREQLRKNIYESGFLETGVERIVDQVVNPKMNTVFLPKVTDVVYQYLGITKPEPDAKNPQIKEEKLELEIKTELLPKELEAVSPESRHEDKLDDSSQSLDDTKIDEDESPPFEPLDEDNSIDSHMSGISGLQSHDSNPLQIDDTQMSKQSSEGDSKMELDVEQSMEALHEHDQDTNSKSFEGDSNSSHAKDSKERKSETRTSKSRSRSESKSDRKHTKDKSRKDKDKDKDRSKERTGSDKDKRYKSSSSSRHSSTKKDEKRDKDKPKDSKRDKETHKTSKDREKEKEKDKERIRSRDRERDRERERKSSSSRSEREKDKDKEKRPKEKKDDHYGAKLKSERRSTDRDSNDGSGLKSSSSSLSESNSSSQHSQNSSQSQPKDKEQSADSGSGSGTSDTHELENVATKSDKKEENLEKKEENHEQKDEKDEIKDETKTISVSAASWEALEAQLTSNVHLTDESELELNVQSENVETIDAIQMEIDEHQPTIKNDAKIEEKTTENTEEGKELKYFTQDAIDSDEDKLAKASSCIETLAQQIHTTECEKAENLELAEEKPQKRKSARLSDPQPLGVAKKTKNSNLVGKPLPINPSIITNLSDFHLPLSPAESDSDKSSDHRDRKQDDALPVAAIAAKRRSVQATQRYSSEDLYKPRPVFKRTTSRRRALDADS